MPTITHQFEIKVTPERYLEACSSSELQELDILLSSTRYQNRMKGQELAHQDEDQNRQITG